MELLDWDTLVLRADLGTKVQTRSTFTRLSCGGPLPMKWVITSAQHILLKMESIGQEGSWIMVVGSWMVNISSTVSTARRRCVQSWTVSLTNVGEVLSSTAMVQSHPSQLVGAIQRIGNAEITGPQTTVTISAIRI